MSQFAVDDKVRIASAAGLPDKGVGRVALMPSSGSSIGVVWPKHGLVWHSQGVLQAVPKLVVLCLNDYPIGVYETSEEADAAARRDWERREPRWREQGLKFGEKLDQAPGYAGLKYTCYYYHQDDFVVGEDARL